MKKLVEDWLFFANNDLAAAETMSAESSLTTIVAFHCQQAIEKYFKAYLVDNDIPFPRIHSLLKLYGMVKKVKDFGFDEDKLIDINAVYTNTRYPGEIGLLPDGLPSLEQTKEFIEIVKEVKTIICGALIL